MKGPDIARWRLANQYLLAPAAASPAEVVARLGAVQAQDYGGAKWGVGQRMLGATDAAVERAFADGTIVRTHVLRPTWHFVAPADLRWLLALTAPRVNAANAYYYRKLELDDAVFRRGNAAIERAVRDGGRRTRAELAEALRRSGVTTDGALRLGYLLMRAELDGVVCSGPRRGKQFTYALLDERVAPSAALDRRPRDESLGELAARYVTTRGPATARDFACWSGLTVADAARGIDIAGPRLTRLAAGNDAHWVAASAAPPPARGGAHLLPNYDEYFIGFKDRTAILDVVNSPAAAARRGEGAVTAHVIVVDGQVAGGWRPSRAARSATVELTPLVPLGALARRAVTAAAERYSTFLEAPVRLTWV